MSSAIIKEDPSLIKKALRSERWKTAKKLKLLYIFFLVPAILFIIFNYLPMYGVIIAFKDYNIGRGIAGSSWNNFEHFRSLFENPYFARTFRNTLIISALRIILGFPAPIILALMINEVNNTVFKRTVQSISYLPHFLSWVVLAGILKEVLSPQRGIVGYIYYLLDKEAPNLFLNVQLFRPMIVVTGIWQSVGWASIIYLAAISSIDPELYESAAIDGANRIQSAIHITLPSLIPIIIILFILRLGYVMNAGFDQIFNMYNALVYEVGDIIDTYVYRQGLIKMRYDYGAAVGLSKNVIGLALLLGTNAIIRRFSEYGIW